MTADTTTLPTLLDEISESIRKTLDTAPEVLEVDGEFTIEQIRSSSSDTWSLLEDAVSVVFDMRNSTKFSVKGSHAKTTARVYTAGVEGAVKSLNAFEANFIDIQGDGGFGLFWGDRRYERALAAAVTIRTMSELFTEGLTSKYSDSKTFPETGFKVGIHASRLIVKKIGTPRNQAQQEPIWVGRAVNYASKCAQQAAPHQVIATKEVWSKFRNNDFIAYSCDCGEGPSAKLWNEVNVERLPDGEQEAVRLSSQWCATCGPDFLAAILEGRRDRDIPDSIRRELVKSDFRDALAHKGQLNRQRKQDSASLRP